MAVDAILIHAGRLVLVERGKEPFRGRLALPGGFVEFGEPPERAVLREVAEETGIEAEVERLLGVYGDPDRDPRGHTISVAYVLRSLCGALRAATDAKATALVSLGRVPNLAFDHNAIVDDYRQTLTSSRRGAATSPSRGRAGSRARQARRRPRGT